MRRREFELLSRLVARVPMRRILAPADPAALPDLCDAIAADATQVMKSVPVGAALGGD
jgi:hypothetical protein